MACGDNIFNGPVGSLADGPVMDFLGGDDSKRRRNYAPYLTKHGARNARRMTDVLTMQDQLTPEFTRLENERLKGTAQTLDDLFANYLGPTSRRENAAATRAQTEADLADVQDFGPQFVEALNMADPDRVALRQRMNQEVGSFIDTAKDEAALGGQLSPQDRARLEQEFAQQASQRGFGYSPADAANATLGFFLEGENLRQRRHQNLAQALGMGQGEVLLEQQTAPDPLLALRGRPSNALAFSQGLGHQAGGRVPATDLFGDFTNMYYTDLYANQAADERDADRKNALLGAGISAAGSILGGAAGGFL